MIHEHVVCRVGRHEPLPERERLAAIVQRAVPFADGHQARAVRRLKSQRVRDHHSVLARLDERAVREREVHAVQLPVREVERVRHRAIPQLDERRVGRERVVHDLVDNQFVLRRLRRTGVSDADGVVGEDVVETVLTRDVQGVHAGVQRVEQRPGVHARPRHGLLDAVDADVVHGHGRGAGDLDEVAVGREIRAAVQRDVHRRGGVRGEVALNRRAPRGDVALHARGVVERDAFAHEAAVNRIRARIEDGGREHGIRRLVVGRIHLATKGGPALQRIDRRVARSEQRVRRRVATVVEDEINVPRTELPRAVGVIRLEGVTIFSAPHGVAVPVARDALRDADARPVGEVHPLRHQRVVGGRRGVQRVHETEKVRVIVRRVPHRALAPVPAVARELLGAAVGGEVLQRGVHVEVEAVARVIELEPVLDLVQVTVRVVGEPLLGPVAAGLLRVLVKGPARLAVYVEAEETTVEKRLAEFAQNEEGHLLAHVSGVAVQVARRSDGEIIVAQQRIIIRRAEDVIADAAERAAETGRVPRAAGVERLAVVDDAVGAIHERAVERLVGILFARVPVALRRGGDPEMILAERAAGLRFPPADEAFAQRRIAREQRDAER